VMTGCAVRQSRMRLPNYLTSRSAGRGQGRRETARVARETLTAGRRGGYRWVRYLTLNLNWTPLGLNCLSDQVSSFTADQHRAWRNC
jgi:hypothetical protein